MRRKLLIYLLTILGLLVFLTACNPKNFTGNRAANPEFYRLDIEQMNGTDTHTMELNAGDTLNVRFETERGKLHMEIKTFDGTLIYKGNGEEKIDFTVNISESGEYSVFVEAHNARGKISIQRIAVQEKMK